MASDGSLGDYCQVLKTQGVDATIDYRVYRPSDDSVYEGQFNGKEIKLVSAGNSGGGGTVESFVAIADDSGTVGVTVPNTWSQVDGASFTDSGMTFYGVSASTNLEAFNQGWSVPGVQVAASTDAVGTDPLDVIATYKSGAGSDCTVDSEGPYDDGYYVGQFVYFTSCGGTSTDFAVLATTDAANTHLMVVSVQMVTAQDKDTVLTNILNSFQASF